MDLSVLKALVGDDPATILEILEDFRVSDAGLAVEIKTACENGEATRAAAAAHKLKSSARAVGAPALGELCNEIEQAGRAGQAGMLTTLLLGYVAEMAAVKKYLELLLCSRSLY